MIGQLSDIARRQKARLAALQSEKADLGRRAALHKPDELARLQSELARLHQLVGELSVFKVSAMYIKTCTAVKLPSCVLLATAARGWKTLHALPLDISIASSVC